MDSTVEKGAEGAGSQEEVKKDGADASTELTSEDITALTEALKMSLDRETKLAAERDNYKEGMLKAKGKLKSKDGAGDEDDDGASGTKDETSPVLADTVKQLLKRNAELVTAVVGRSQIATSGQGTGSDTKVEVGDNLLSTSQVADLKARGWDDVKIARFKQNLLRARP